MSSSKVEHEESQLADTSEETEKNDPLLKFPGTEFKTDSGSSNPNIDSKMITGDVRGANVGIVELERIETTASAAGNDIFESIAHLPLEEIVDALKEFYKKYTKDELVRLIVSKIAELERYEKAYGEINSKLSQKIWKLKNFVKQVKPVNLAVKLRFLIEALERICKPSSTLDETWESTARYEKWETLKTSDHPLIKKILDCLFETQSCSSDVSNLRDSILMVYYKCDGKIYGFFFGFSTDDDIFSNSKIASVIKCLEDLDEEVLSYYENYIYKKAYNLDSSEIGLAEVRLFNTEKKEMSVSIAGENESELKVLVHADQKLTEKVRFYNQFNQSQLAFLAAINDIEVMKDKQSIKEINEARNTELKELETFVEQTEPLRLPAKFRYVLEKLEKVGKPGDTSYEDWAETNRSVKWETIIKNMNGPDEHFFLRQFLEDLSNSQNDSSDPSKMKDSILALYKIYDEKMYEYLRNGLTDQDVCYSPRIMSAINCLEAIGNIVLMRHDCHFMYWKWNE